MVKMKRILSEFWLNLRLNNHDLKPKRTAFAGFGQNAVLAAVYVDYFFHDGESQTRSGNSTSVRFHALEISVPNKWQVSFYYSIAMINDANSYMIIDKPLLHGYTSVLT
jgi:hypothetical protein